MRVRLRGWPATSTTSSAPLTPGATLLFGAIPALVERCGLSLGPLPAQCGGDGGRRPRCGDDALGVNGVVMLGDETPGANKGGTRGAEHVATEDAARLVNPRKPVPIRWYYK